MPGIFSTDVLWRNALVAVPLAIIVAAICRFAPCRPATRHMLWLTVLLALFLPPGLPRLSLPAPGAKDETPAPRQRPAPVAATTAPSPLSAMLAARRLADESTRRTPAP